MIYIKYYRNKYDGPYLNIFNSCDDAMKWIRQNPIEIVNIDIM